MVVPGLEFSPAVTPHTAAHAEVGNWISPLPTLELHDSSSCARAEVEAYIRDRFQHKYGAQIEHFLPQLFSLRCAGLLTGCAGVSSALQHAPLFLEHYLDAPIEVELQARGLADWEREGIVEIGNLVATSRGASRIVFIVLASVLHRAGMKWMVFTATSPLYASLQKLGMPLLRIREADISRLPAVSNGNWGTYYEHRPEVVAANLDQAIQLIDHRKLFHTVQQLFGKQIDVLTREFSRSLGQ
jgi:hypothetical protein